MSNDGFRIILVLDNIDCFASFVDSYLIFNIISRLLLSQIGSKLRVGPLDSFNLTASILNLYRWIDHHRISACLNIPLTIAHLDSFRWLQSFDDGALRVLVQLHEMIVVKVFEAFGDLVFGYHSTLEFGKFDICLLLSGCSLLIVMEILHG